MFVHVYIVQCTLKIGTAFADGLHSKFHLYVFSFNRTLFRMLPFFGNPPENETKVCFAERMNWMETKRNIAIQIRNMKCIWWINVWTCRIQNQIGFQKLQARIEEVPKKGLKFYFYVTELNKSGIWKKNGKEILLIDIK